MSAREPVVGVVAKQGHFEARPLVEQIVSWLSARSTAVVLDSATGSDFAIAGIGPEQLVGRNELASRCTHLVILGGDGTLISACRHGSAASPVIIGVNLGTLGFLTEITVEEMIPVLKQALDGSIELERRFLLEGRLRRDNQDQARFTMLNDLVISKQALARIFSVQLFVDGEFAAALRGDGVIVATPGGSTAYSLAAGGSIVHPQVQALLVTPICPHSLTSRPLVLPGSSKLRLTLAGNIHDLPVFLTLDGQEGFPLEPGDEVYVTTSPYSLLFAKSPSRSYYQVLGAKLKWTQ